MNVGSRVILHYDISDPDKAIIKTINKKGNRALVEITDNKAVSGKPQTLWVSLKRLTIDKEWYRDIKIKKILNG